MNPSPRWSMTFDRHPQKPVEIKIKTTASTLSTLSPALRSLGDLLFANADAIPQGLYLKLMDHLKELAEEGLIT